MQLSIVLPTLNEVEGLKQTLKTIPFKKLNDLGYEIEVLVVDAESTDGTPELAEKSGCRLITEPRRGYGRAYKTGLQKAAGEIIITGDADGTYPFNRLPEFLETVQKTNADYYTVNRYAKLNNGSMSLKHRLGNWVLTATTRTLYKTPIKDSQSGMWLIRRNALPFLPLELMHDGMPFSQQLKILAHQAGKLQEIPGELHPRIGDIVLESWRDGFRNLKHLFNRRENVLTEITNQPGTN